MDRPKSINSLSMDGNRSTPGPPGACRVLCKAQPRGGREQNRGQGKQGEKLLGVHSDHSFSILPHPKTVLDEHYLSVTIN